MLFINHHSLPFFSDAESRLIDFACNFCIVGKISTNAWARPNGSASVACHVIVKIMPVGILGCSGFSGAREKFFLLVTCSLSRRPLLLYKIFRFHCTQLQPCLSPMPAWTMLQHNSHSIGISVLEMRTSRLGEPSSANTYRSSFLGGRGGGGGGGGEGERRGEKGRKGKDR